MALLRHARRPTAGLSLAIPLCATGIALGAEAALGVFARRLVPAWVPAAWGGVLVLIVLAWSAALARQRTVRRRGVRTVGQWVRSARIAGGQLEGLAAVRAGAPLAGERATGWLSLERELVRFQPDGRCGLPEACWTMPWSTVAVVDVAPAALWRHRVIPGLRRSLVGLRFKGQAAALVIEVDDDPKALLRSWRLRGMGHSSRGSRADR